MITLDDVAHRYALTDDEKTAVLELCRTSAHNLLSAAESITRLRNYAELTARSLTTFAARQIEIYPQTIRRCAELTGATR